MGVLVGIPRFAPIPEPSPGPLLLESGDELLLEDNSPLETE